MAGELSLDEESLFSLELVVDKLKLQHVACRFPAVAFRLLDFPTLMIYHVEPDFAQTIKEKIAADPHYKVAPQLTELQDREGYFPVKKGKSCLFRVPASILRTHLQNVPLYVMIVDTFPETPKLLATCTVLLNVTMESVYSDICNMGLSVPAVSGEKGKYSVFNLMGIELGHIFLGFRILSLGVGLMAHIPSDQVIKLGAQAKPHLPTSPKREAERTTNEGEAVVANIETTDHVVQVAMGMEQHATQTDEEKRKHDASVQTKKVHSKETARRTKLDIEGQMKDPFDDMVVTNSVCPPPLYYNSKEETYLPVYHQRHEQAELEGSGSDFDSDDTIREEDRFSDEEIKALDYKAKENNAKGDMGSCLKSKKDIITLWLDKPKQKALPVGTGNAVTDYPVINALIAEVMAMQNRQGSTSYTGMPHTSKPVKQPREASTQQMQKKETKEEFLSRISSPRRTARDEMGHDTSEPRKKKKVPTASLC